MIYVRHVLARKKNTVVTKGEKRYTGSAGEYMISNNGREYIDIWTGRRMTRIVAF